MAPDSRLLLMLLPTPKALHRAHMQVTHTFLEKCVQICGEFLTESMNPYKPRQFPLGFSDQVSPATGFSVISKGISRQSKAPENCLETKKRRVSGSSSGSPCCMQSRRKERVQGQGQCHSCGQSRSS